MARITAAIRDEGQGRKGRREQIFGACLAHNVRKYPNLGQLSKKSDFLLTFDIDKILGEGYDLTTSIIVTNTNDFSDVTVIKTSTIYKLNDLLTIIY